MSDLLIVPGEGGADIIMRANDARVTSSIEVAVFLSLFTPQSYADMINDNRHTSRVPEIIAQSNVTNETRRRLVAEAERALAWMIEDNVASSVEADAVISAPRVMELTITITRPAGSQELTYAVNWDEQLARLKEAK